VLQLTLKTNQHNAHLGNAVIQRLHLKQHNSSIDLLYITANFAREINRKRKKANVKEKK